MTDNVVNLSPVVEDADLVIIRGRTDRTEGRPIVVFASAGIQVRQAQRLEFIGMIGRLGRPALFIADPNRSWYGHRNIADRITRVISDEKEALGVDAIDTIGASMGGFGALAFAERVNVTNALAFSPRFSPDRRLIEDSRLSRHLDPYLETFPFRTAEPGCSAAGSAFVIHGTHPPDLPHIPAYADKTDANQWVLPVPRHEVGQCLRESKTLWAVVSNVMEGRSDAASAAVTGAGAVPVNEMRSEVDALIAARNTIETSVQAETGPPGGLAKLISSLKSKVRGTTGMSGSKQ